MIRQFDRSARSAGLTSVGPGTWLLVAVLAAEVVVVTRSTDFPNGSGVPYWGVWLVGVVAALAVASVLVANLRPSAPRLSHVEVLAILAIVAMALTDVTMAWQPLRDLGIYLKAGEHFRDGSAVYLQTPLTVQPLDRTNYPFLYPPPTLPLFGALSMLPIQIAQSIWLACSLGLGMLALRRFGVARSWLIPALLWPPLFQGIWVGNVAVPVLALFALGPSLGAGLVIGAVFKPYTGLAALWLVRERRSLQIAAGAAALVAVAVVTLPLTGLPPWTAWLDSLRIYQDSQQSLPGLYGFGLLRYLPFVVYAGLAVAAVLVGFLARGRDSLARLGTATVVASPSLFGHGLLVAIPSMLSLRSSWLWLAVGFLSTPDGPQWWLAIVVVAASWVVPTMRLPAVTGPAAGGSVTAARIGAGPTATSDLHPLGTAVGPWPRG